MDDTRLAREIEALFAIDPAPDFKARLRCRIAQEPPLQSAGAMWRFSWSVAAAAALAAAIGSGAFLRVTAPPPQPTELVARSSAPAGYAALPAAIAAARVSQRLSLQRLSLQRLSRREPIHSSRRRAQADPEVIIDPSEVAAWRRLLADMSAGRIEAALIVDATETMHVVPEGFVAPPVIIEPLTPDVREQGVHP